MRIVFIDLNPSPIGSEPLDGAPSTIGIDGGIEDMVRAHDIGFDRFHRQEPAGRDLLEGGRVEDGIDTAHRHLEGGGIEEGEEGVGHGGGGGEVGVGGDEVVYELGKVEHMSIITRRLDFIITTYIIVTLYACFCPLLVPVIVKTPPLYVNC